MLLLNDSNTKPILKWNNLNSLFHLFITTYIIFLIQKYVSKVLLLFQPRARKTSIVIIFDIHFLRWTSHLPYKKEPQTIIIFIFKQAKSHVAQSIDTRQIPDPRYT